MTTVCKISADEFRNMREDWNGLLDRSSCGAPMLTWEWMYTWWEQYDRDDIPRELYVLSARRDGSELVGLLPFVKRPAKRYGVTFSRLEFMGTGEAEADETCSQYLNVILDSGDGEEVARAFADHLSRDGSWDEIVCRDFRDDETGLVRVLCKCLREAEVNLYTEEFGAARCPLAQLPDSWESYLSTLSHNRRKQLRRGRRALESDHSVSVVTGYSLEDVRVGISDLVRLHQARWQGKQKPGCFASPVFTAFLNAVGERMSERNGMQITRLSIDEDAAAVFYVLRYGEGLYLYSCGVDLERYAMYSPGNLAIAHIVEEAIAEGAREVHFFKAGGPSYKHYWTERFVPVASLLMRRKGSRHVVCRVLDGVKDILRRVRSPSALGSLQMRVGIHG